jgi:hypothetical protein
VVAFTPGIRQRVKGGCVPGLEITFHGESEVRTVREVPDEDGKSTIIAESSWCPSFLGRKSSEDGRPVLNPETSHLSDPGPGFRVLKGGGGRATWQ